MKLKRKKLKIKKVCRFLDYELMYVRHVVIWKTNFKWSFIFGDHGMGPTVQHTTASLTINERNNCNVLEDVGLFLNTSIPEVGIEWNVWYHEQYCHLWPPLKELQYIKFDNWDEFGIYATWQFTYTVNLDFYRVRGWITAWLKMEVSKQTCRHEGTKPKLSCLQ